MTFMSILGDSLILIALVALGEIWRSVATHS